MLTSVLPTALALSGVAWLLPGLDARSWWVVPAVGVALGAADLALGAAVRSLAQRAGAVPAVTVGLAGQVALVVASLSLLSGGVPSLPATAATLLLIAVARAAARRVVDDRASAAGKPAGRPIGVVIVQVDGLPFPVLRGALASGILPTLARWLGSGTHDAAAWWARVPSSTPASQAALLHGTSDGIPGFRWYDKRSGRVIAANRPADAAMIELRMSDGRGLLAGRGVSVSNLFTGDAPVNRMVVSRPPRGVGAGSGADYVGFFGSPVYVVRAAVLTLTEMAKDVHQGRQQRRRRVEPRVHRGATSVVLRGLTNVLLHELDVVLVTQHMMRGAPVVYVTFVDYDEIAHHAGVTRPEALSALAGLDRVLRTFERAARTAPRDYRFVVLSDHGQSQGCTFLQLTGHTLEAAVRAHAGLPPTVKGRPRDVVVTASGNVGLVWFPGTAGRLGLEALQDRYPALIPGLLGERGIGFVVVGSARGPVAIGPRGVHLLRDGRVEGEDPLAPFGPRAAPDLARVAAMDACPDLLVHSTVDPATGEVHAFEELVGSHGGLGGWQNQAVLVHPRDWPLDDDLVDRSVPAEPVLYGAEAVHRQLVRWLAGSGLGAPLPATVATVATVATGTTVPGPGGPDR